MEAGKLGPLDARIVRKTRGRGAPTVEKDGEKALTCVLLHGFGAPGDDLVALAEAIDAPVGTTFVFPEALRSLAELIPSDMLYPGAPLPRAWWMIDVVAMERAVARGEVRDLSRQILPKGVADARAAVLAMLDALASLPEHDAETPLVLGGFSQGAMLALDVALHDPSRNVQGLVLLSGTLLSEGEWVPRMNARKGTPVFQSHGRRDPILPFSIAERLRDALSSAGLDVTFDAFDGPHTIPPSTLDRLGGWLRGVSRRS